MAHWVKALASQGDTWAQTIRTHTIGHVSNPSTPIARLGVGTGEFPEARAPARLQHTGTIANTTTSQKRWRVRTLKVVLWPPTCMHAHTHIYTHVHDPMHMLMHTHIHKHMCPHIYIHTHTHMHAHTYTHEHIHIHTYTHVYMHINTHTQWERTEPRRHPL